jgi:hypothetical protein
MTDTVMSADELIRARATLGFSADTLAADLGLPPAIIAAWEDGRDRVPRHIAKHLRWLAAITERQQAIEASGLPECVWVEAFEARPEAKSMDARTKQLEELLAHSESCPACLARTAYANEHCPPLPPQPMPLWAVAFGHIGALQHRLPVWARPAVSVGLVFGAYSVVRAIFWIPRIVAQPKVGLIAIGGIALSTSIGAGLGLLYGIVRYIWDLRKPHGAA